MWFRNLVIVSVIVIGRVVLMLMLMLQLYSVVKSGQSPNE